MVTFSILDKMYGRIQNARHYFFADSRSMPWTLVLAKALCSNLRFGSLKAGALLVVQTATGR